MFIRHKYIAPPFENVDLFPLICKILGLETRSSNGTFENVKNLIVTQGFAVGSPVGWAIGKYILTNFVVVQLWFINQKN